MLRLLCLTDPTTHREGDTTPALVRTLANSDAVELWFAHNEWFPEQGATLQACRVPSISSFDQFQALSQLPPTSVSLFDFSLVLDRSDAPLPLRYYERLAAFESEVRMLPRPSSVLAARRKGFLLSQPALRAAMPPHCMSSAFEEIEAFFEQHGDIVVKEDLSYGGRGVHRFRRLEHGVELSGARGRVARFDGFAEAFQQQFPRIEQELQCVQFLVNVYRGDKRVLVVENEIYGAFVRRASDGGWVQNVGSGGTRELCEVSEGERQLVAATAPTFTGMGLPILGYDFLCANDGVSWHLSEVNCGNVSGFTGLESLTGAPVVARLAQWLIEYARR